MMNNYRINSECGIMDIEADSVGDAKEQYSRKTGYDFDSYADFPGSWYFIVCDDVRVEDHSENMP